MKVFTGNSNPSLAKAICDSIGIPLGCSTVKPFPNGETFVKIDENVRGTDVFVIQSTSQPANQHLMEMFIMIDALRRASASRITAVLPFYGYARQDRKDQPRVPITAKLVANLLVAAGVNRVLTMDLHAQQIQGSSTSQSTTSTQPPCCSSTSPASRLRTSWWSARIWGA